MPANALISTIFAQTTPEAMTSHKAVAESLHCSHPEITSMGEEAEANPNAFAGMPRQHWQMICTTQPHRTPQVRDQTLRRRHPDPSPTATAATRLIGAVLQEQHKEWPYGERRDFSDTSMHTLLHNLHKHTEPAELYITA
jgi:Transposase, Mutator family.